jgi:FkbM family methyltransferase
MILMKRGLKTIYSLIPFKREAFTILKKIWIPKESIYKHLHFKGEFQVQVEESRSLRLYHPGNYVENGIFWNGILNDYEKESLKLWIKLCKRSTTILDIGANSGIYSLLAKTIAPKSNVYAFEPHQYFYSLLKRNNDLNKFDINCIDKAVSDNDGTVVLEDFTGTVPSLTFESITLDSFISGNNIPRIDLIKIDVERHEPQVLAGFSKCLNKFRPAMIIEILDQDIADKIGRMVANLDYLFFNINEDGQIRQTSKIEKSDSYNYLLCNKEIAISIGLIA